MTFATPTTPAPESPLPPRSPRPASLPAFVLLLLAVIAAGCDGDSTKGTTPPEAAGDPGRGGAPPAAGPDAAPADSPSAIIADRITGPVLAPVVIEQKEPSPFRFEDVLPKTGIEFRHVSGVTADKHFPTANGSGVALFDYDNDGLLDIYLVTTNFLPVGPRATAATGATATNKLYRNRGDGTFEDVTEKAGLAFSGFCHAAIAGDFDNDGDQDLFLATYKQDRLYENLGDGTFRDVTGKSGIRTDAWSSSGAWLDYNNDGLLDLYVSTYGVWEEADAEKFCGDPKRGVRLYCSPLMIQPTEHMLYRNNGDGTFTNVYNDFLVDAAGSKIPGRTDGRGFGVVAIDVDNDGLVDVYVANDISPNFLYLNKGGGVFEDATELSGAAYDEKGQSQSGMGVDANDYDGDGLPELFVTNFSNEYNTLYKNMGGGTFNDVTAYAGLAAASMPYVGWGCALEDFDNDGWVDCMVANGHVDDNRRELGQAVNFEEPALLFRNVAYLERDRSTRRFELSTRDVGPYFEGKHVSRGLAYGDLDNDGDVDVVINQRDGRPAILINNTPTDNHRRLTLKLVGTVSNRDAIGAKIEVTVGDRVIHRWRKGGGSLMATNDPRVHVGLGAAEGPVAVKVRWPSGQVTELADAPTNTILEIVEPKP